MAKASPRSVVNSSPAIHLRYLALPNWIRIVSLSDYYVSPRALEYA